MSTLETVLVVLWLAGWVAIFGSVIALSVIRCPKCGGYHLNREDKENCHED